MPPSQSHTKEEELEKKLADIRAQSAESESQALAQSLGLPFSNFAAAPIENEALMLLSESESRSARLAIVIKTGTKLTVATANPNDPATKQALDALAERGFACQLIVTTLAGLEKIWQRYATLKTQEIFEVGAIEIQEKELEKLEAQINTLSDLKQQISKISTTKLLEILIAGAIKTSASDVHFETESDKVRLRYRLDGVLNDITTIDKNLYEKVLNRIKVLARLKLNIHTTPQDGRFTIRIQSTDIEVRVSVLPSEYGETIVTRLLDPRTIKTELEKLGVRSDLLTIVKKQLDRPNGAILNTGPTGSGKTTTLYAFVQYLNSPGSKIITIEDPIEYHVEGISQTQVNPSRDYTFANGLRAIVRQDPDIILVGEIRDTETAEIALQAALTGHLVLSTIHTNDAAGTIPRLINLGIKPEVIAPAIHLIMAQRLVRKLCPECKTKKELPKEVLEKVIQALGPLIPKVNGSLEVYYPNKCKACNETGYQGRIGVFEAFAITEVMEKLILSGPANADIENLAVKEGMVTMLQDAYLKLLEGVTSLEEIERVVG